MTFNISDNALRDLLKQGFLSGYNSPMEEKAGVLDSVLASLKEKEALKASSSPSAEFAPVLYSKI